ncbi:hypothetical protein SAMN05216312_110161 [Cohnella sp. OV330]|uniref:hypothetical protein n=1 Tax=Cohnella sp. OV330 TaxID=1855288 RepID=UPI0008EF0A81|nr:hypothetical protein [Cohnella sp. OV330]SFB49910.1 hypothetical protein SAMN05216312_110161 [Cohnella sp. OV330]
MLEKFFPAEDFDSGNVGDLDLAKILLVALDIHLQRDNVVNPGINDKLQKLFSAHDTGSPDWSKILNRYREIIDGE